MSSASMWPQPIHLAWDHDWHMDCLSQPTHGLVFLTLPRQTKQTELECVLSWIFFILARNSCSCVDGLLFFFAVWCQIVCSLCQCEWVCLLMVCLGGWVRLCGWVCLCGWVRLCGWVHLFWIGLDLFNDDTRPSGHISRPTQVNVSQSCFHSLNNYSSLIIL